MCLCIGTPKAINFPFVPNGTLMCLGGQIFKNIRVYPSFGDSNAYGLYKENKISHDTSHCQWIYIYKIWTLIQLAIVNLYTKYEVSFLYSSGDIFDEKVLWTDRMMAWCKPQYPTRTGRQPDIVLTSIWCHYAATSFWHHVPTGYFPPPPPKLFQSISIKTHHTSDLFWWAVARSSFSDRFINPFALRTFWVQKGSIEKNKSTTCECQCSAAAAVRKF